MNTLTFGKPSWFPQWQHEHTAAREGVILMNMTFMSKFLVEGRDAGRLLDWISANGDVPVPTLPPPAQTGAVEVVTFTSSTYDNYDYGWG